MEFNGNPTGTLRDVARWQVHSMTVEFTLDVRDDEGDHAILCRWKMRHGHAEAARLKGPKP